MRFKVGVGFRRMLLRFWFVSRRKPDSTSYDGTKIERATEQEGFESLKCNASV